MASTQHEQYSTFLLSNQNNQDGPVMGFGKSKFSGGSRRPLYIVSAVFIVIVVIVGAVVWKVTKDAYDDGGDGGDGGDATSGGNGESQANSDSANKPGVDLGPNSAATTPSTMSTAHTYTEEELKASPWLNLRLPRDVRPLVYDITIYPDFYEDGSMFYGNESIECQLDNPRRVLLIHIHTTYLNVTESRVTNGASMEDLKIKRTFYYAPNEFFVIEMEQEIPKGSISIHLSFEGSLVKDIKGIYKSTYLNTETNQTRQLVTSKFEPTFARRAFPCFDEPNVKAEYIITLIHRPDYTPLSNMPTFLESAPVAWNQDLVSTEFKKSEKMSTYLVCFTVCDFKYVSDNSSRGIPIRVFSTPDKIKQTSYALEMAKHTLDNYENLFGLPYPLPKQDLIAIPDFISGAMEHWGLISFRESRLLYSEETASLTTKEDVAHVVAHEMAHQWFGNIVTMDWWNDLWLNEGFASFMEYIGIADKETTWDIDSKFLTSDMFPVMLPDSELSSHPIIVDVERPSQITSVFDSITYQKGASVIRMLQAYMGKDLFFKGVQLYLKKFQWMNAKTIDLWNALTEVFKGTRDGKSDVEHIMNTWTLQDGYPYVNITVTSTNKTSTTLSATQQRFLSSPQSRQKVNASKSPFGYKWYIPLNYARSDGVKGELVMDMKDITTDIAINLERDKTWIKFNSQQHGFYRVLYPDFLWDRFASHLMDSNSDAWKLPTADRAGLLSDAFSLANAGLLSYKFPLAMMSYMDKEREYVPWRAAFSGGISYISRMLRSDPEFGVWKNFLVSKIGSVADDLGFTDTGTHIKRTLRPLILGLACDIEYPNTMDQIQESYRLWLDNGIKPKVNLRRTVYVCGMESGGTDADWNQILDQYKRESSPSEKEALASTLASTKHPHLIAKLLSILKEGKDIKSQDFFKVVGDLGKNAAAQAMLWDWTRENYQNFIDRFSVTHRYFGRMVYYMVRYYNTDFKLREVKDLFAKFPEAGSSERYRRMAVESIENNIYWMRTYKPIVIETLAAL